MQAGKLDHKITIEQLATGQDDFGGVVEGWSLLAEVWAEVQEGGGREYHAAARTNAEVSAVFIIRYRSDVTPNHRINYGGKFYNIISNAEIGRRVGLRISVKAAAS